MPIPRAMSLRVVGGHRHRSLFPPYLGQPANLENDHGNRLFVCLSQQILCIVRFLWCKFVWKSLGCFLSGKWWPRPIVNTGLQVGCISWAIFCQIHYYYYLLLTTVTFTNLLLHACLLLLFNKLYCIVNRPPRRHSKGVTSPSAWKTIPPWNLCFLQQLPPPVSRRLLHS